MAGQVVYTGWCEKRHWERSHPSFSVWMSVFVPLGYILDAESLGHKMFDHFEELPDGFQKQLHCVLMSDYSQ